MTARFIRCSETDYHNDPSPTPSLSSSIAKVLIEQSPKHAWLQHPKLGGHRWAPTPDMDAGTIIHALVLGEGAKIIEVDADDFKGKAARAQRDAAREKGSVPVIASKMAGFRYAAERIKTSLSELDIALDGESELTALFEVDGPYGPVACRSRLDHFKRSEAVIYDIKKIPSAHPLKCERQIVDYGYDIQEATYRKAVESVCPELRGRLTFILLFCEIEEPYCVTPVQLDGQFRDMGVSKWERAVTQWATCLRTNHWPAYAERGRVVRASPPPWAIAREIGEAS